MQSRRRCLVAWMAVASLLVGAPAASAQTVGSIADASHGCSGTSALRGLTTELARAEACMYPSALVELTPGSGMTISSGALPYTSPETRTALYAARRSVSFNINSAFRTVLEQYYLYTARAPRCGSVATPGSSNHESGTAVDIREYGAVHDALIAAGCTWPNYTNDPWHYNCLPSGARRRTVLVFQRLWNLNHPEDPITPDGVWGPQTQSRLRASPAAGFSDDGCGPPPHDCSSGVGDDDICAAELLNEQPAAYARPRSTDVDGDGRADLCARGGAGVYCWTASSDGWSDPWPIIPWADAHGWDDVTNYATLRMGDVNGDGLADVCARSNADFLCALSTGSGFEVATAWRPGLSDAGGWDDPQYYTTLRLADVNGDGMDDLCARDSEGFGCWLSNGTTFDQRIDGPRWSNASGFSRTKYYGTLRMGDLDGDRLADVCVRAADGMHCALSDGEGFPTTLSGPAWSDDSGFGGREYWSTIRLADIDGDERADLCARTSADLRCARSVEGGFDAAEVVAALSDESGWADPTNYRTLRVGDIDADGGDDLCARANTGMRCWGWDGTAFTQRVGPEWSDATSWGSDPRYYETIRLADFDGDGLDDLCARAGAGWRCHPSMGDSFGPGVTFDELTDARGWVEPRYWSTIMSAGHACRAEMEACNGLDDDCDGMVDENIGTEICNATDDDCDGTVDEGLTCDAPGDGGAGGDGGSVRASEDGGANGMRGTVSGGCACRASAAAGGPAWPAPTLIGLLVLVVRMRRRRRAGLRK